MMFEFECDKERLIEEIHKRNIRGIDLDCLLTSMIQPPLIDFYLNNLSMEYIKMYYLPYYMIIQYGYVEAAKILLESGANPMNEVESVNHVVTSAYKMAEKYSLTDVTWLFIEWKEAHDLHCN